jgi:effector-binding domain-containing protein
MAAVFPVSDSTTKIKGMSYIYVPAGKAVAYTLIGPYSGERAAHYNILSYVFQKGLTPLMVVEEYEKGPMTEVDSNKWETKIYYLVQ